MATSQFALTPKKVSKILGKRKYDIALKFGVTSRVQVYKVLRGISQNPELLLALYDELQRIMDVKRKMGIITIPKEKAP